MNETYSDCPSCNTKLKSSLIGGIQILNDNKTRVINEYHSPKSDAYCNKCGNGLYDKYKAVAAKEKSDLSNRISELLVSVPVITISAPQKWDYDIIGMITGQSTTGTGVVSEFASSFTDLFGMQSGKFNKKLKTGEDYCFAQLKLQALNAGGNAVIATDIDYSEVGGDKGMLMVCMAGTAVKINNLEVLGSTKSTQINELISSNERIQHLNTLDLTLF